jgi:hypothetical protein
MGLIRRRGTATVAGANRRPCTLEFMFSKGGPGGATPDIGGRPRAWNAPVRETSVVRKPRVKKVGTRND